MKLLQIGPHPPPLGGWAFHIKLLKEDMREKGHISEVLNIGTFNRTVKSPEYIDVQNGLDYIIKNIKYNLAGYEIYYHVDGGPIKGFLLNITSQLIALMFGRRIYLSFHAGIYQKCFEKKERLRRFMAAFILKLSKVIICNSDLVKNRLIEIGAPREKIYPIPAFSRQYMTFEERLTPDQEEFFQTHDPVLISYLFFRDEYTPDILIKAIDKLRKKWPKLGLFIVCAARDPEEAANEAASVLDIKQRGLENNIRLITGLSHDNYLSIVKRSAIFVRTPESDGVSSSVLEAIFLKTPVVASQNNTRPKGSITYESGNINDLVATISSTLNNIDKIRAGLKPPFIENNLEKEFRVLSGKVKSP
ncbi:glycosyltransferase family 4 protein [Desulfobacterales bacterium HSG16]|nr:glycosyltransferase family 4 protein [Desulfobacterales bacterium HSG16]